MRSQGSDRGFLGTLTPVRETTGNSFRGDMHVLVLDSAMIGASGY
jgi:hypothetical protein